MPDSDGYPNDAVSLSAVRALILEVLACYPEDIFSPGGSSPDAQAAAGARVACQNILRLLDNIWEEAERT